MRLILTTIASAALLMAAPGLISDAFAHGGAYRGPAGEVPPDSREPSDPPPPPEGGGPTTPGGETGGPSTGGGDIGGPSTGGGDSGGPSSGGGGTAPTSGGGGAGGPSTGGAGRPKTRKKSIGYEDWTFWWNFNKDDILQLKSAIKRTQTGTGTAVHVFGKGKKTGKVKTATDAAIQEEIVPALRKMLTEKKLNFDIQSAAALALAKIGDTTVVPDLMNMARNRRKEGADYHNVVQESAALAIGLLQDDSDENVEFLMELVVDERDEWNSSFVRPFAAISLGLLGGEGGRYETTYEMLMKILARKENKQDIKPACLVAIGLLGNEQAVPDLLFMLENEKAKKGAKDDLNNIELSFVVQALGKIGRPGTDEDPSAVIDALEKALTAKGKKKADKHVRRSASIALGQIAPQADAKQQGAIIKMLKRTAKDGDDASERNFAMIALGRLAASEGIEAKTRDTIVGALQHYLDKGKPSYLAQPFAGIAMGLVGRTMSSPEEAVRKPLRLKFAESSKGDPRARGAYAIASGLVRDTLAVPELIDVLNDRGADKRLRGYAAVALGMIGDGNAKEAIRATLTDDNDRDLRKQTAIAAGLMGDASVIGDLVEILKSGEESQYILGSVALSLGQIGDERAIAPLLAIATDSEKKYPDITRALATVALGQIGDRRDVPVLSRVARDINFRAIGRVPSLTELLTIL